MSASHTGNDDVLDAEAFEELYRKHWEAVLNYARLRVGDADAYDVAADAFGRAWAARARFKTSRGSEGTWLWAIVRNTAIDWGRRSVRRTAAVDQLRSRSATNQAGRSQADDDLRAVIEAVQKQRAIDQEIVALRFGAGHTNRAIAQQLGMTESNVAVRLHRTLRRIRTEVERTEAGAS